MVTFSNFIYQINFGTEALQYRIIDSPVARIWLDVTQQSLAAPDSVIYHNQSRILLPSENNFQMEWRQIVSTVGRLKALGIDLGIEVDDDIVFDDSLDYKLNRIHQAFHDFHERYVANHEMDNLLEPLNAGVHRIQQMFRIRQGDLPKKVFATFFIHSDSTETAVQIDRKMYSEWNYYACSGDLTLGYHTVGKNLMHCWRDNDIKLVADKMVRPQKVISNEVGLTFGEYTIDNPVLTAKRELFMAHDWVLKTGNANNIDLALPENRVGGAPLLGQVIGKYSVEDANYIFSQHEISHVSLTKVY